MSNNPIALYRNLLAEAGTIPEGGAPLIDDDTTQRWLPADTDALVFENLPGVQVTHIGVAAHNLGTEGGSFLIETGDGTTWTTLTTLTATDDQAFLVSVGPVAVQSLRITAQGDDLQLGILYVGEALEFERRLYQGHTPIVFGDGNTLVVKDQRGGQYVGNQVRRRARSTKVSINNLTPQFIRQRLEPFRQHYNDGGRFFFSWRPQKYAGDAVYARGENTIELINSGPAAYMQATFAVRAYVQTYRPEFILPPEPPEPEPSQWTPGVIATAAWFDSTDLDTLTLNGSSIAGIADKSGNSRSAEQIAAFRQPEFIPDFVAGLSAADYDGAQEFMSANQVATALAPLPGWSVAVVYYLDTYTDSRKAILSFHNSGTNVGILKPHQWFDGTGNDFKPLENVETGQLTILIVSFASGTVSFFENGTFLADFQTGALSGANQFSIAQEYDGSVPGDYLDGKIPEVVFTGYGLDANTRQLLEGYMAWKYGIQGKLPVSHPYKNGAPTV